jgi:hypothetical protein
MAEVGESRAVFFLSSGYVFGIWGLIYTLLIGFVIYQFRPVATINGTLEQIGWWFVVSPAACRLASAKKPKILKFLVILEANIFQ